MLVTYKEGQRAPVTTADVVDESINQDDLQFESRWGTHYPTPPLNSSTSS